MHILETILVRGHNHLVIRPNAHRDDVIGIGVDGVKVEHKHQPRPLKRQDMIILMDEPSMGLSPIYVNEIFTIIETVSSQGTTVLLVEQNAKKALSIADRAYVLETGSITTTGVADDLLHDDAIRKAYLGE